MITRNTHQVVILVLVEQGGSGSGGACMMDRVRRVRLICENTERHTNTIIMADYCEVGMIS